MIRLPAPAVIALAILEFLAMQVSAEEVRFVFDPNKRGNLPPDVVIQEVSVAGQFNNWDAGITRLYKQDDGTFAREVDLPPGVHPYKLVVNGKHWFADPTSDPALSTPDNFGEVNSGVKVEGPALSVPSGKPFDIQGFRTPDWAKHVVWYQIMLDRFRNGDPSNDPPGVMPWRWDWGEPFTTEEKKSSYGKYWGRQFGGDIEGLTASLDYLEDLGITGIYLNPIFKAPGAVKYNTSDYRHVDDHFGKKGESAEPQKAESLDPSTWTFTPSDQQFLEFLKEAHRRGFKVILDGVFNHCGEDFWAFRDVVQNERASPYAGWFVITDWDASPKWFGGPEFEYRGWHGFGGLPEYAEDARGLAPGLRQHVFDVSRRWMDPNNDGDPSDGIDGWRLDAADDVEPAFWVEWRRHIKAINPDALIVGEIWKAVPELVRGEHFDGLMNYQFAMPAVSFFVHTQENFWMPPRGFQQALETLLATYPMEANSVMMNLFGSHDVDRVSSMVKNPNRAYDNRNRLYDNPSYDISRPTDTDYQVVKLMVTFQTCFPGAPLIWYGDEAGMFGSDDPANRMPMWWDDLMPYDNSSYRIQKDMLEHTRRMIAIRNSYPALRTGRFTSLSADDARKVYVFERRDEENRLIVGFNLDRSPHTVRIEGVAGSFADLLDPTSVTESLGEVGNLGARRRQAQVRKDAKTVSVEEGVLKLDLLPNAAVVLLEMR